jgi:hypothetical protein
MEHRCADAARELPGQALIPSPGDDADVVGIGAECS